MEPLNNKLTINEVKNALDTMSANTAFIENAATQGERPLVRRTSRSISRRKLTIFVSVSVAIVIIILVIIIPILGLRKSD
ncbi:unnamed protein product [Rotaria sp. Silwood1]|nr:unnamed protein product [Rotaria sp. Silwood1]CAF1050148.1 unnamed protein product [Rotaria sp. Silwood1]CAF1155523.1 unnamed protein product [Rotaria sp. Silwood1]CAF3425761.1 unnamed protein product [Rotaria sp. Silwood1]CAF3438807.1 unnamed protein product [Rotaria sp. Silwood1]